MSFIMPVAKPYLTLIVIVRYTYKRDHETQDWYTTNRPFREQWLTLMGLVGIKLPKYTLPALKPKPILTNDEALHNTFKPQLSTKSTVTFL